MSNFFQRWWERRGEPVPEEMPISPRANIADRRAGDLLLIAITPEMLRAEEAADRQKLARLLRAHVTSEWPPEHWGPHVLRFMLRQLEDRPDTLGWHRYMLRLGRFGLRRTLVGALGAFPGLDGDVEIGYSTLPAFQRRGYATATAQNMVEWLLQQDGVCSVSAQTYPRVAESIKVMKRCGLSYVGDGDDPGTLRYRRFAGAAPPTA